MEMMWLNLYSFCSSISALPGYWEWQDETQTWRAYTSETSRYLECASVHGLQSQSIKAAGRGYTVHFGQRMEQVNDSTNVARPVQRCGQKVAAGMCDSLSNVIDSGFFFWGGGGGAVMVLSLVGKKKKMSCV